MKKLVAIIALFAAFAAFVPTSFAGFSMTPSSSDTRRQFNFQISPGGTKKDSVIIQNNNDAPLTLLLYGADGTHSNQGSFALVNRTAVQRTVGKWVQFDSNAITLQAGEKKEIPFTITLPSTVTPGNYAGGIAAETTTVQSPAAGSAADSSPASSTGAGVVISSRLVVKLFVSVPGQKNTLFSWDNFSRVVANDKQRFSLDFSNTGNTVIAVDPVIDVTGLFGGTPVEIKLPESSLLQSETINVPYEWDQTPFFGLFKATATVTFFEYDIVTNQNINPTVMTKTISFWVIPWLPVAIIIVLLLIVIAYFTNKKLRMKRLRKRSNTYEVQEGETIIGIAETAGISWRRLAKLNKLHAPYALKKGDKLQVPTKK
jgi:LysM repeat protein